ncbi:MAG TPA: hypothetical protein VFB34_01890 [Chloroflexota bacterium]|nr:hypothetical protein [Chloroflexota bacterium]
MNDNEEDAEMDEISGTNNERVDAEDPGEMPAVVAHFEPPAAGDGLDGTTPLEAGIQGRLTEAGGRRETPRNEYDWQPHVEVDQPVQEQES